MYLQQYYNCEKHGKKLKTGAATWERMSSIMWPYAEKSNVPWEIDWITIAESPSKITSIKPISIANCTVLQQANAYNSTTNWHSGTDIFNDPIASPYQSRIMTLMLAKLHDLNTATSKFALKI